jgi:hypothetical protein
VSRTSQAENIGWVGRLLAGRARRCAGGVAGHRRRQSAPLPQRDVTAIYQHLSPEVEQIKIFDGHARPGNADDPEVDAMAARPSSTPFRLRDDSPERVAAA